MKKLHILAQRCLAVASSSPTSASRTHHRDHCRRTAIQRPTPERGLRRLRRASRRGRLGVYAQTLLIRIGLRDPEAGNTRDSKTPASSPGFFSVRTARAEGRYLIRAPRPPQHSSPSQPAPSNPAIVAPDSSDLRIAGIAEALRTFVIVAAHVSSMLGLTASEERADLLGTADGMAPALF